MMFNHRSLIPQGRDLKLQTFLVEPTTQKIGIPTVDGFPKIRRENHRKDV